MALAALVTMIGCWVAPSTAMALPSPAAPAYAWPEMHQNPQLTGYSPDPGISSTNAASLGVSWMTYTGATVLSSPVVAWNAETSKTLVYVGNESGYLTAYDQATGAPAWSQRFSVPIRSTPLVEGGSVWISPTASYRMYKLDAGTGAVQCSAPLPYNAEASPTIATPPGGKPTVYTGVLDSATANGPLIAIDEATCAIDFSVTPEPVVATGGVWDSISYGVSATGEGLVLFGTSDMDQSAYAIDAVTGATVWRFTGQGTGDDDFGAGITISAPGVNGFPDGVAYAMNKDGYLNALDLTTGALYWTDRLANTLATPALDGSQLVVGSGSNVLALNAVTGAVEWTAPAGPGTDASPAIVGPSGSEVVAFGDLGGTVRVLSLATGASLATYQTGNYITSGIADVGGNLVEASADGFLYDFAPGGGTASPPSTAVTSPANAATLANPKGNLTVSGTAGTSGGPAVGGVTVAVQSGGTAGTWWDGATGTWVAAPYPNPATLSNPGTSTTSWRLVLPVPASGGAFEVFASAVGTGGVADRSAFNSPPSAARVSFTVSAGSGPTISLGGQYYVAPATAVSASGAGFTPGETVSLSLNGSTLATAVAGSTGTFGPTSLKIPVGTSLSSFGPANLTATGQSSGLNAVLAVYLSNAWTEAGQAPLHQSYEANDNVLADQVNVSSGSILNQAWLYSSGAPVSSSPVIYHATAFFSDTSGGVSAVNIATGMTRWHVVVAGGSSIDASPAIAAVGAGVVMVGTASGSVVALNALNGSTLWSTSIGTSAIESSPSVAVAGTAPVVFVGNDAGVVSALKESTGAVMWQTTLGGAVQSSPAVDTPNNLLVVGDGSGHVTALNAGTGATKWSFTTGGPVVASALLYQGGVYIGSESGSFYDIKELTGVQTWVTPTAGAITASAALLSSGIYTGDSKGNIYSFSPTSGASTVIGTVPNAVVGVSTTVAFVMVESAGGNIWAEKQGDSLAGWKTTLGGTGAAAPVVVNGTFYATASNGLHCFTLPGVPPV